MNLLLTSKTCLKNQSIFMTRGTYLFERARGSVCLSVASGLCQAEPSA